MADTAAPARTACIDPDGTPHEHCPLHGCVEYVCCMPAGPALDRALTFALIEVAMVILMGAPRATLTLPQRAGYGRQARALLELGVQNVRDSIEAAEAAGVPRATAIRTASAIARQHLARVDASGDVRAAVTYRGQLAELAYIEAQLAGR